MKRKTNYQTLFAVHMTCDHCVKSVSDSLYSLEGITSVDANLKDQLVTVEGTGKTIVICLLMSLHMLQGKLKRSCPVFG